MNDRPNHKRKIDAMRLIVVTGLSGSGKSYALKSLEDLGYFCVDNLPPRFLPSFIRACERWMPDVRSVAVTVDIRERAFLRDFPRVYHRLKGKPGLTVEVLFLEASEEALARRFSETRRPHPLAFDRPVLEGIREERHQLEGIRMMADRIIDTTALSVHQLRRFIFMTYGAVEEGGPVLQFISFGYRYGVPFNADLVFDARFLPNPYFEPDLRYRTGLDPDVRRYVLKYEETRIFLKRFIRFLNYLLPCYKAENKHYITVAIGCTGGKHRSVVIVEWLARYWERRDWRVEVEHRDIEKP